MNPSPFDVGPAVDLDALVASVRAVARPAKGGANAGGLAAALAEQAEFNRSLVGVIGALLARVRELEEQVAALGRRPDGGAANGVHKG